MGRVATERNLCIQRGCTWEERITYRDRASGKPVDLAGFGARMQVRATVEAEEVLLDINTDNGRLAIDAPNGVVKLRVDAPDTRALSPGNRRVELVYDLELVDASQSPEYVIPLFRGHVIVQPEVTR